MSRRGRRERDAELSSAEKALVVAALNEALQVYDAMPITARPPETSFDRLDSAIEIMERA